MDNILEKFGYHKFTISNVQSFKYKDSEDIILIDNLDVLVIVTNTNTWSFSIISLLSSKPIVIFDFHRIYNFDVPNLKNHNINILKKHSNPILKGTIMNINGIIGPLLEPLYGSDIPFLFQLTIKDDKLYTTTKFDKFHGTYFSNTKYRIYINKIYMHITNSYSYEISHLQSHDSFMSIICVRPIPYITTYNLYDILIHVNRYTNIYKFSNYIDICIEFQNQ